MTYPNPEKPIAGLLEGIARQLDITNHEAEAATKLYEELGAWLVEQGPGSPEVYPQGSFRLGTVVRPVTGRGEYDIDLVFWRDLQKTSTTQAELRQTAGELLASFCLITGLKPPEELGRCWRIHSADGSFHIDVLPVIPDHEHPSETAILLSDRDLREWQYSNPIAYADWFYTAMGPTLEARRFLLAEELGRSVEEVPRWYVRTPLQRAVQLFKRHRDLYFGNRDDAPPSILITTLAARAYQLEEDIEEAFRGVAARMESHVEMRNGEWWVANPVHREENFADKWNTHPERRDAFFLWLKELQSAIFSTPARDGLDGLTLALGKQFGQGPAQAASLEFGKAVAALGASGGLAVNTITGTVTTPKPSSTVRRRPHTFHGE